jgi:uncharacterized protein (TIGR00661 family)
MSDLREHKKILVAVLDWGLGHAARMIPLIRKLQEKNFHILIGSSGSALQMLRLEFPDSESIELPAYKPVYHEHLNMTWSMALQTPRFLKVIYEEHHALKKIVRRHKVDGIISDNRYGMFHRNIPCVLITHQLFIQAPAHLFFLKPVLKKINFQFVNRFNHCWIPDTDAAENLSGALSRESKLPPHARFIGLLSRFEKKEMAKQYDLMLLLSGPEPQRSVLEKKLLKQLQHFSLNTLLVRGVFEKTVPDIAPHITVKNFLSGSELENALNSSDIIIARSGYSTAMDLIQTDSKGIFIPTPGQTEQEYLAGYWKTKKWFYSESQHDFDLQRALNNSKDYYPRLKNLHSEQLLEESLNSFLNTL